jgi:hypothetical protein
VASLCLARGAGLFTQEQRAFADVDPTMTMELAKTFASEPGRLMPLKFLDINIKNGGDEHE